MKKNNKVFLIIPTIRDLTFLDSWADQLSDVSIIVCEDRPKKSVNIPKVGKQIYHYSWKEIDKELGKGSWIIPRKVSAIRNFGFLKAYQMGADIIITVDDDCYPVKNHNLIELHTRNLNLKVPQKWTNTNPDVRHLYTRGMPYLNRDEAQVMLSHGLWTSVLDHDGPTHLQHLNFRAKFAEHFAQIIPQGAYFPMCSMNFAFRRDITPLLYFPLMGEDNQGNKWGYDRFDDIWAGVFAKKVMDHLGLAAINGAPFVEHRKASDPFKNLQKEAKGIETNEVVWKAVQKVHLTQNNPVNCYIELIEKIEFPNEKYFKKLKQAMHVWVDYFIK